MKLKYKAFDYYAQEWFYVYAHSKAQALVLIRKRVLALNGKYNLSEVVRVP